VEVTMPTVFRHGTSVLELRPLHQQIISTTVTTSLRVARHLLLALVALLLEVAPQELPSLVVVAAQGMTITAARDTALVITHITAVHLSRYGSLSSRP
jgi:hypothetical protein